MVPAYAPQRSLHVLGKLTKGPGALLTPPLPSGWDDASEEDFYARTGPKSKVAPGGIMSSWVAKAMSSEFLS